MRTSCLESVSYIRLVYEGIAYKFFLVGSSMDALPENDPFIRSLLEKEFRLIKESPSNENETLKETLSLDDYVKMNTLRRNDPMASPEEKLLLETDLQIEIPAINKMFSSSLPCVVLKERHIQHIKQFLGNISSSYLRIMAFHCEENGTLEIDETLF